jgi:tetratricopeptide (TPR) repeat protein
VIRLQATPAEGQPAPERIRVGAARRAFDYDSFEAQLESLWFQRKALLESRRSDDAAAQLERIHALCSEEGVRRLESLTGALISEARAALDEGDYDHALAALHYAGIFDPDRPQVQLARAEVYWYSGAGPMAILREIAGAVRLAGLRAVRDLSLSYKLALLGGLALAFTTAAFSMLMLLRHHTSLRHEVEEWAGSRMPGDWPRVLGWGVLGLPLMTWVGAGWALLYWPVLLFRYMSRKERLVTLGLLIVGLLALPAYRTVVGLYGTAADPTVRTTLASAGGEYDPDRVVRLRQLVESHPEDPIYHFLLAGLYKNGRYFEEAFNEYKKVLEINPRLAAGYVNLGNTFYATGQYGEAANHYREALEIEPDAFAPYFNLYLTQSEEFRFSAAEQSLNRAHEIDRHRVTRLLASGEQAGQRPAVQDAGLEMTSVWEAAIEGHHPLEPRTARPAPWLTTLSALRNGPSIACMLALALCLYSSLAARRHPPASCCTRCGRPFCTRCKSGREAKEYCSQCVHLYVLRDGLAPETKARKLYEVERQGRRTRWSRRLASALFPGTAHVLRGRMIGGLLLMFAWSAIVVLAWTSRAAFSEANPLASLLGGSADVPARFQAQVALPLTLLFAPLVWLVGNVWRHKTWEA